MSSSLEDTQPDSFLFLFHFGFFRKTSFCKKYFIGVSPGFWYLDLCLFRDALKCFFADCADDAAFYS